MKKQLLILVSFLLAGFLLTIASESYAQTKKSDVLMLFTRQSNGKVAQINVAHQKEFTFFIQGLTTQTDVDNFVANFTGKGHVVSVKISEIYTENQRKGMIVLDPTAKLPDFKELLRGAGVTTISIDGELKSVDELVKVKKESNRKVK
jgi:hypothetical protein